MKKQIHMIDTPLYKLSYTARVCQRYFSLFFKENCIKYGVTEGEYVVMDTIFRSPEMSQIELARLLFKGRAHITQILNSLEARKLIERTNGVKNGRKISRTVLTHSGQNIHFKIISELDNRFADMFKYFEKKEDTFVGMLSEIREILTDGENVNFD